MISAGCTIHGTVKNSVLAPGVIVERGAVVRDSILFADCIVEKNSTVDLTICDKRAQIRDHSLVGSGMNHDTANILHPKHLYTGITLVGKEAIVPSEVVIGRNCIINSHINERAYLSKSVADGETL